MTTAIPLSTMPAAAVDAYERANTRDTGIAGGNFSATLQRALEGVTENIHAADTKTIGALEGNGSMADVITAIARAELALQTATAVRDRIVQAYQDIMKMPI